MAVSSEACHQDEWRCPGEAAGGVCPLVTPKDRAGRSEEKRGEAAPWARDVWP